MARINRDTLIAVFLLLVCGIFIWASFDIREPDYGTLKPSTWPRVILGVLSVLSLIYLVQSLRQDPEETDGRPPGLAGWLSHWRNVLWCFGLLTNSYPLRSDELRSGGFQHLLSTVQTTVPPRPSERIGRLEAEELEALSEAFEAIMRLEDASPEPVVPGRSDGRPRED